MEATTEATMEATKETLFLLAFKGAMARRDLQEAMGLKSSEHLRKQYLVPALDAGIVEMTIPDKLNSPNQRYRLTEKGENLLKSR